MCLVCCVWLLVFVSKVVKSLLLTIFFWSQTSHTIKITLENKYRSILRTIRKIHQSKRLTMKWIFRSYEICMFMTRRIWTLRMLRSSGTIFLKTINNSIIITILLAELNNDHGVQFTSHWLRFYLNCDFIVPTLLCSSIEHTGNY